MTKLDTVYVVAIVLGYSLFLAFVGIWAYENIILWVVENSEWWKILIAFLLVFSALIYNQMFKRRVGE